MATAIRILLTASLMHRAHLLESVPFVRGTLYLAEVDRALKVETWECAEMECDYTEDVSSPSSR